MPIGGLRPQVGRVFNAPGSRVRLNRSFTATLTDPSIEETKIRSKAMSVGHR